MHVCIQTRTTWHIYIYIFPTPHKYQSITHESVRVKCALRVGRARSTQPEHSNVYRNDSDEFVQACSGCAHTNIEFSLSLSNCLSSWSHATSHETPLNTMLHINVDRNVLECLEYIRNGAYRSGQSLCNANRTVMKYINRIYVYVCYRLPGMV